MQNNYQNNPIIRHAQQSLLQIELSQQKRENMKFKLLLMKTKKENAGCVKMYNNHMIAYPKGYF